MQCDGVTQAGRSCGRRATRAFLKRDASREIGSTVRHWDVVAAYCAQHANGAGAMRLLLPLPWEFDGLAAIGIDGLLYDVRELGTS